MREVIRLLRSLVIQVPILEIKSGGRQTRTRLALLFPKVKHSSLKTITRAGGIYSDQCDRIVQDIAKQGGTPLVVAKNHKILGVIHLKDIIKQGVKEKFADLRKMGIKTIMITCSNPMTAAASSRKTPVTQSAGLRFGWSDCSIYLCKID